jgi:hypothetical protein
MFSALARAQKIDPAPSSLDQFITITGAAAMAEGQIELYTSATAATCSAANTAAGSAAQVGREPNTSNFVLRGNATSIAIVKGVLLSGNYVCAAITPKGGGAPVALPAVQIAAPAAPSGGTVTINPAPSSSDQFITVIATAAMAGGDIAIYTATSGPACTASASKMELQPNTGGQVLSSGTTEIAIIKGKLLSGTFVCAVVTVKGSEPVVSAAVKVMATGTVPVADIKFHSPDPPDPANTTQNTQSTENTPQSMDAEVDSPKSRDREIVIETPDYLVGGTLTVLTANTAEGCAKSTTTLGTADTPINGSPTRIAITPGKLIGGNYVCVTVKNADGKTAITQPVQVNPGCDKKIDVYSDCTYEFTLFGGIEQSGLSAENSITNGFYDLSIRRPVGSKWASIWFRSRYLGGPSTSSTSNVVAAATNPTGTVTASNLPQSVVAVDYVLGLQLWKDMPLGSPKGRFTLAPVVGFGATTPLDSNTTVNGFQVPQVGTNECNQLHSRFTTGKGYDPALPGSGYYTNSTGAVVQGCVVQPPADGTTTSPTNPGAQITAIAFSNEDRSNFLLKWGVGVRLVDRYTPTCLTSTGCPRLRADFSIGQDESITGGSLSKAIFKADAIVPIFSTGTYFFASSANRLARNETLSPLILTPVTVNSGSSSACSMPSATSVCVPSPNVFVLPYKQPDRDYYRIGVGVDAVKILTKLFTPPAS